MDTNTMSQNVNAISVSTMEPTMDVADQSQSQSTITSTASIASSSPATSLQSLSLATSIDEKGEKLKITLDNPTNTYYSGQTIHGTISLNCKQKKKIRGIYFRVLGYGKCSWTDLFRSESTIVDGKGERSAVKYSGTEEYLNTTMHIVGSKNGPVFTLPQGMTSYDFQFMLKPELPSSFTGGCGKIKYKLEFIVDKPWKFDEKQTIVLNIIQTVNLNYIPGSLQPFENQLTRTIGYIGSGPISVHVFVPKSGFVMEEMIPVQVIISNNSRIHVDKVKFALNKITDYHSKTPGLAIKREVHRLLKKEAGGVNKKTEQRYEHLIYVPITAPSQDSKTSQLIHIKYQLKVEAKLSGLYKNLVIAIPITIGNVGHSTTAARPMPMFPSLPDLPPNLRLSVHLPYDHDRNSIASNSSYISIPSGSPNPSLLTNSQLSNSTTHDDSSASLSTNVNASMPPQVVVASSSTNPSTSSASDAEFRPTAPPMDEAVDTSRASIQSATIYADAPPSYDEVFGSPSTINHSNVPYPTATTTKT